MTGEHIFLNKVCLSKRLASLIGLCICVYLMLRLEMFSLKQILLICFCVVNIIDLLICASEKITHNVREIMLTVCVKLLEGLFEVPKVKHQVATGCITIVQTIQMLIVGLLVEEGI